MLTRYLIAGCVAGLIALPSTAFAQRICGERDSLITKLKDKYGEAERGMGLSGAEAVVEVWSSSKTGTWTIVMTRPDGMTCVMAAGDNWMQAPPEKGPKA